MHNENNLLINQTPGLLTIYIPNLLQAFYQTLDFSKTVLGYTLQNVVYRMLFVSLTYH